MALSDISNETTINKDMLIEAALENLPSSYQEEAQELLNKAVTQDSLTASDLPRIADEIAPRGTDDDLLFEVADALKDLSNSNKSDLFTAVEEQATEQTTSVDKADFIEAAIENLAPADQPEAQEILDKAITQPSVSADDLPRIAEEVAPQGIDDDLRFELADNIQDLGNPEKSHLFAEKATTPQQLDSEIADVMASVTTQVSIADDNSISQSNAISDEALQRNDSDEINR